MSRSHPVGFAVTISAVRFIHPERDRFWEIEHHPRLIVVRFGAVGDAGRELRLLWSEAYISAEIAQRIEAKLAEGYVPTNRDEARIESLMAQMRERPDDPERSLVLADAWMAAGDVRGERIVLQHALHNTAEPQRSKALEARLLELLRAHKDEWMNGPGGWPFREQWVGRNYIEYDWYKRPRWTPIETYRVFRRFMERFTTSIAPMEVYAVRTRSNGSSSRYWTQPYSQLPPADRAFCQVLEDANALDRWKRERLTWTRRRPPEEPEYDVFERALEAAWAIDPGAHFQLRWYTELTFPDSAIPLPFHDGAFYAGSERLRTHIRIRLDQPMFELDLRFPYQDPDNPLFESLRIQMQEALDYTFLSTKWRMYIPTKNRHGMKRRKLRLSRVP